MTTKGKRGRGGGLGRARGDPAVVGFGIGTLWWVDAKGHDDSVARYLAAR